MAAAVFLYNLTCTKSPQVLQAACSPSLLIPVKRLLASLHVPLQTALLAYLRTISMFPKRTYLQEGSTFGNLSKLLGSNAPAEVKTLVMHLLLHLLYGCSDAQEAAHNTGLGVTIAKLFKNDGKKDVLA